MRKAALRKNPLGGKILEIKTLEIFLETMELRNFSSVARKRGVEPSSISREIARLEKALGAKLFERESSVLVPTEAAEGYFERIRQPLQELEAAGQDARSEIQGRLTLAASQALCCEYLMPRLQSWRRARGIDHRLFARSHRPGLSVWGRRLSGEQRPAQGGLQTLCQPPLEAGADPGRPPPTTGNRLPDRPRRVAFHQRIQRQSSPGSTQRPAIHPGTRAQGSRAARRGAGDSAGVAG